MKNKLQYYRKRVGLNGMSQEELAKKVGTHQSSISDYERFGRPIPRKRMILIAAILGRKLEAVFPEEKEAQSETTNS